MKTDKFYYSAEDELVFISVWCLNKLDTKKYLWKVASFKLQKSLCIDLNGIIQTFVDEFPEYKIGKLCARFECGIVNNQIDVYPIKEKI